MQETNPPQPFDTRHPEADQKTDVKSGGGSLPDLVPPAHMVRGIVEDAVKKDSLAPLHILIRAFLCTPFLAYATTLSALLVTQGWPSAAAGLLFPVGYVILAFLGLEMVTGSFSVMPIGAFVRRVRVSGIARAWVWTYIDNLAGGSFLPL